MKWYILNYRHLRDEGFSVYPTTSVKLLFTMRGCCMIDAFDLESGRHAAYLDFDMQREAVLAYAFGSPVIGLPFTAQLRRAFGTRILPFKDLRSGHGVGLYVKKEFRNKGAKGLWNLDEIMMAVALETAFEHGMAVFTVQPTGDRAPYYRRKFNAETRPTTAGESIVAIDLQRYRKTLKHIELVEIAGRTYFFKVKGDVNDFPAK